MGRRPKVSGGGWWPKGEPPAPGLLESCGGGGRMGGGWVAMGRMGRRGLDEIRLRPGPFDWPMPENERRASHGVDKGYTEMTDCFLWRPLQPNIETDGSIRKTGWGVGDSLGFGGGDGCAVAFVKLDVVEVSADSRCRWA